MNVDGKPYRTIWPAGDGRAVEIIDQTGLPHEFIVRRLETASDVVEAIGAMRVRGAPLIGAAAAYGVALALAADPSNGNLDKTCAALLATRPTAVNLRWALQDMQRHVGPLAPDARAAAAWRRAAGICDQDVDMCRAIGGHGVALIRDAYEAAGGSRPVEVLTHCNAGWLATVDWGTATAPIYMAHDAGIPVHVWVDETRPRNQGAALTAWELGGHGVPHTVIVDSAGGHLMQHGRVDLCITGTDRTTAAGDVANKIGTYLKALAAGDNRIPFYVAVPGPSIDWTITEGMGTDGIANVPIEERDGAEVATVTGRGPDGAIVAVAVTPAASPVANPAFDVTPARLISGLITERGVCAASNAGLAALYPEFAGQAASAG